MQIAYIMYTCCFFYRLCNLCFSVLIGSFHEAWVFAFTLLLPYKIASQYRPWIFIWWCIFINKPSTDEAYCFVTISLLSLSVSLSWAWDPSTRQGEMAFVINPSPISSAHVRHYISTSTSVKESWKFFICRRFQLPKWRLLSGSQELQAFLSLQSRSSLSRAMYRRAGVQS